MKQRRLGDQPSSQQDDHKQGHAHGETAPPWHNKPIGGVSAFSEANGAFHLAVAQAGRNAIIADLVRHCLDQVTRFIALGIDYAPLQKSASGEHDAVVDAIERRDPEGARAAVERHLDDSSRRMMDALIHEGTYAVTVSRAAAGGS